MPFVILHNRRADRKTHEKNHSETAQKQPKTGGFEGENNRGNEGLFQIVQSDGRHRAG